MKIKVDSNGMGFWGVLGLIFVVLKLTEVIDWSWWWVTLPFWLGPVVAIVFILIAATVSSLSSRG
ncbi:MAG: hypothetical protein GY941_29340 [Planctomycetes bacterium]|nr:hypothetical protein [Planctomycetota bacterium]